MSNLGYTLCMAGNPEIYIIYMTRRPKLWFRANGVGAMTKGIEGAAPYAA
jgi:hypothetical protein